LRTDAYRCGNLAVIILKKVGIQIGTSPHWMPQLVLQYAPKFLGWCELINRIAKIPQEMEPNGNTNGKCHFYSFFCAELGYRGFLEPGR